MRTLPKPKINNRYDILYLAGYAADESTLFIDRRMPRYYTQPDGKNVDTYFFLGIHEAVEVKLIDAFGMSYQESHACATKAEMEALRVHDIDTELYNKFMDYWEWVVYQSCDKAPRNLDLAPYVQSNDEHALNMIKRAQENT